MDVIRQCRLLFCQAYFLSTSQPLARVCQQAVLESSIMALTDYETYLKIDDLLSLQKDPKDLITHDEMQFQIVHQVTELWMKLIQFELKALVSLIDKNEIEKATLRLGRIRRIQKLLIDQLDILDTMSPKDYTCLRTVLGKGSGQESPSFQAIIRTPGKYVWPAVETLLDSHNVTLREIYDGIEEGREVKHFVLYHFLEALVDYDQLLQTWRYRHLLLVYRIIGEGTPTLKGKPTDLLAKSMKVRFFPELWNVRSEMFEDWSQKNSTSNPY